MEFKGNLDEVVKASENYSGSEIEVAVKNCMYQTFEKKTRVITEKMLKGQIKDITPLFKTAGNELKEMRSWAKGRAKFATTKLETKEKHRKM